MLRCRECNSIIKSTKGISFEDGIGKLINIYYCLEGCKFNRNDLDDLNEQLENMIFFKLTFPNPPTWNGQSSYDDLNIIYSRVFYGPRSRDIINQRFFDYKFEDGWNIRVEAYKLIDNEEVLAELEKANKYNVYEHMIGEILEFGSIKNL